MAVHILQTPGRTVTESGVLMEFAGRRNGRNRTRVVDNSAVITGAASGLGRALALAWAERGWKIGVADVNEERARETLEMVREAGGSGEALSCNVRNPEDVRAMADHFFDSWGGVGVLVNNAGVADVGHMGEVKVESCQRIIETNLWGGSSTAVTSSCRA